MRGFRIARIFGIDVVLDPSWILIFAFLSWSLAAMFARMHPGWASGVPLALAATASALFFLSVLLHELAHALVAIASGLRVRKITLFFFGGVASIEEEPKTPGSELLMALAGPAVSIGLGFWMSVLSVGALGVRPGDVAHDPGTVVDRLGVLGSLFAWLGPINVMLGLFNLIPAFPLDGGRVFRAILWATTKDLRRATSWATATGQAFAWLFIVLGIAIAFGAQLPFFGSGFASGLWLVLIGWFLNGAAARSHERLLIEDALAGLTAARVMRRAIPAVAPEVPLSALVSDWFMSSEARAFPVVHDSHGQRQLIGLVCLSDLRAAPRDRWSELRVRDVMTPIERLVTIEPGATAFQALERMSARDVSQIPVVEGDLLVGMVERRDLVRWLEMTRTGGAPTRPSWAR